METTLTHWIDGKPVPAAASRQGENPATGGPGDVVGLGTAADVDRAVRAAAAATPGWRHFPSAERGRLLNAIARRLRADLDELVELERLDTGKPAGLAAAEIGGAADYFEFYASLVSLPVGDVLDITSDLHVYTRREPFGVVGVITPWNLPMNQAARACAPALTAGNTVVAKPAESTSRTTVALARIATQEGLPNGVLNVVLGQGSVVGTAIVEHPLVRKVAFTGSVPVGQEIGRIAADRILPLTLELGGKSANIVFADADLDFAAAEKARALRPGTDLGPMITRLQYETVQRYFEVAAAEGAAVATGGAVATVPGQEQGFYVEPTIYTGVSNQMRIAREEVFGPVLTVIAFDTEEEAVTLANDSEFGLVGGVFTADITRAFRVAESIEAGQVYINSWSTQSVQMPFGGHKQSGYGREKGIEALSHYSHVKSISVCLNPVR